MSILTAILALGGLTLLLAIMLIIANRKLYVYEDPRINVVEDMLPHANCGACGFPGCRPFAEALVAGKALPGKCTVSAEAGQVAIAEYLGISIGAEKKGGTTGLCRWSKRSHQQGQLCRIKQLQGSNTYLGRRERMFLGMPWLRRL